MHTAHNGLCTAQDGLYTAHDGLYTAHDGLQVASFAVSVDMRQRVQLLQTEMQEGQQALTSLQDVMQGGFDNMLEQTNAIQAK